MDKVIKAINSEITKLKESIEKDKSRYKLEYFFLDGTYKSGCFYSVNKLLEFYDIK